MNRSKTIAGEKFGRLTPIEVVDIDKYYNKLWLCRCDCGNEIIVRQNCLKSGNTRSCGCLNDEVRHRNKKNFVNNCKCENCGKDYYLKPSRLGKSLLHFCSQSCRTEYIKSHPEMIPTYKNRDSVSDFFYKKFIRSKFGARKRGVAFSDDLTPEYLIDLWNKQRGLCYYTGIPMSFDPNDELRLVSVDRIDSKKGYEPGNLVLCTYAFNSFKFSYPKDKIIEFISLIRRQISVKYVLGDGARLPSYATSGSAGLDLYSSDNLLLKPGHRSALKTGVKLEIPAGFYGMCVGRSGNTVKNGLFVQTGIIDSDYRGEIGVMAYNGSNVDIKINIGDRIGQLIIMPYPDVQMVECDELSETDRGIGGYGSTGK